MYFKLKQPIDKIDLVGTKRVVKKFLFLPRKHHNTFRWLEFADIQEEFVCETREYGNIFCWEELGYPNELIKEKLHSL
jgi:hypothetical protein